MIVPTSHDHRASHEPQSSHDPQPSHGAYASYASCDGTRLAYRAAGAGDPGRPLVCLPGGPMRAAEYLGDLGGLTAHRRLVLADARGTGGSEVPADRGTYRVDRQVADVEALRVHLGLERMDLLAHSAAGNLALLYAAAHPERIRRLVLVTPNAWTVGLGATPEQRLEAARERRGEPWFEEAYPAFERLWAEGAWSDLVVPFFYGRWDAAAAAHAEREEEQFNEEAAEVYRDGAAYDPAAVRAALARLGAEVLVLAGERDGAPRPAVARELASLFPAGRCEVQPGAAHFPWLDDPEWFAGRVEAFLAG
ncbi:alpha/beta fold hydrolase [Streptomyces sp. NPDC101132]|uniref:alpha/beta fold hydrolase n=1 Tax=Streptomyces sp. NPDC101132 TaxID=3366110 RepID=UPI00380137EC